MARSTIGRYLRWAMIAAIAAHAGAVVAQEAATQQTAAAASNVAAQEMLWLVPHRNYGGDWWDRPALTGDWGGLRQKLMDNGLRFDFSLTQTIQGNITGGTKDEFTYQGRGSFGLKLDTGHAGLWPGGMLVLRGEGRYGRDNNPNTGALMPVNTDALFPVPGKDEATLSELYYVQFLATWVGLMAGRMSPRDANVFAHDETDQFMNTGFNLNPVIGTTIPLCFLGAGGILLPADWLMLTTLVLDSEGRCNTSGFDTVFKRGTSVFQQAEFKIKPFGLPGHQRVGWTWSDRSKTQFTQDPRTVVATILCPRIRRSLIQAITSDVCDTAGLARRNSDWSFFYDFDQYVYLQPGSTDRGIGLFGRIGVADKEVNPIEAFYSIGVSGKGLIPGREKDTFGIGYYYLDVSDKLPAIIRSRAQDEQGGEIYYNIALTSWLHITPDFQIIEPARRKVGTVFVGGLRTKIDF